MRRLPWLSHQRTSHKVENLSGTIITTIQRSYCYIGRNICFHNRGISLSSYWLCTSDLRNFGLFLQPVSTRQRCRKTTNRNQKGEDNDGSNELSDVQRYWLYYIAHSWSLTAKRPHQQIGSHPYSPATHSSGKTITSRNPAAR